MKRKVITYFLLSVFLFSTIGVPIAIHYCQMMNSVSLQACEICENSTSNCCKDEETETTVVSYQNDSCCNTKIIADPLTEKYISAFYELQKVNVKTFEYILPLKTLFSENLTTTNFALDNSPPAIYSNSRYLDNSLLLI
jgi:Cft2 family RNA processing exonuclease